MITKRDQIEFVLEAYDEIHARGYKKGNGGSGILVCPKCGGTLHFRVAGCNGHIHGMCETKDCLRWME